MTVSEDWATRDKIVKEEGVICFEIEAAWLMDNFRSWAEGTFCLAKACRRRRVSPSRRVLRPRSFGQESGGIRIGRLPNYCLIQQEEFSTTTPSSPHPVAKVCAGFPMLSSVIITGARFYYSTPGLLPFLLRDWVRERRRRTHQITQNATFKIPPIAMQVTAPINSEYEQSAQHKLSAGMQNKVTPITTKMTQDMRRLIGHHFDIGTLADVSFWVSGRLSNH